MARRSETSAQQVRFGTDDIICLQGERIDALYRLDAGVVRVMVLAGEAGAPTRGKVLSEGRVVATLDRPGLILGEPAAMTSKHSASVVAAVPVTATRIPVSTRNLSQTIAQRPQLGLALARSMARRVFETYEALHLTGQYIARIQNEIDGHCLGFMEIADTLHDRGMDNVVAMRIYQVARSTFSYRRGLRMIRERASAQRVAERMVAEGVGRLKSLHAGEILFREGDPARTLYIIKKGGLDIEVGGRRVDTVRDGEVVGEVSVLLPDHPMHTVTVRAVGAGVLTALPAEELPEAVERMPELIIHIGRVLSRRLEAANQALFSFDRHVRSLLGNLIGGQDSCERDHQNLAQELAVAGDELSHLAERSFRSLAAVRNDHSQFQRELTSGGEATRLGASYESLRARSEFAALEQRIASIFVRFRTRGGAGTLPYEELLALIEDIWTHHRLGGRVELKKERANTLSCHVLAVTITALGLGEAAGMHREYLLALGVGALLHDIGMIVPEGFEGEFVMKEHPVAYSREHLKRLTFVPDITRQIIYQHEELLDGSGYPEGLKGDRIEMPARIVGLANTFDLLIARGLDPGQALEQIKRNDAKFDPALLQHLHDLVG